MSKKTQGRVLYNLDGSPYGTKGIGRLLSAPAFLLSAAGAFGLAAMETTLWKFGAPLPYLVAGPVVNAAAAWGANELLRFRFRKSCPLPPEAVIDKSGYQTLEPDLTETASVYYAGKRNGQFLCGISSAALPFLANAELPPVSAFPALHILFMAGYTFSMTCFFNAFWSHAASDRLEAREWTIRSRPPAPGRQQSSSWLPQKAPYHRRDYG